MLLFRDRKGPLVGHDIGLSQSFSPRQCMKVIPSTQLHDAERSPEPCKKPSVLGYGSPMSLYKFKCHACSVNHQWDSNPNIDEHKDSAPEKSQEPLQCCSLGCMLFTASRRNCHSASMTFCGIGGNGNIPKCEVVG